MSYINKASSGASDDASLDAFYVQSVPGGASMSRQRQGKQKRKRLYAAVEDRSVRSERACKASRASESGRRGESVCRERSTKNGKKKISSNR